MGTADQTGSVDTSSGRLSNVQDVMTEAALATPVFTEPLVEATAPVFSNLERELKVKADKAEAAKADKPDKADKDEEAGVLDGTTAEVLAFAEANPGEVDALLAAEEASSKPRKGVLEGLAALQEAE